MENHIFKKFNSLEHFKKIFFFIFDKKLIGPLQVYYNRHVKLSSILINKYIFIYNGLNFIRLKILFFYSGLSIGMFCFTKKNNRHLSFKKLKTQKR